MLIRFIAALALAGTTVAAHAASATLETVPPKGMTIVPRFQRSGMWETTSVLERNGKKSKPIVKRSCILEQQVDQAERDLFQPFRGECTGSQEHDPKHNTISWTYECNGKTPMRGSGSLTYKKDEYSGTSESTAMLAAGKKLKSVKTKTEFSAKRIDDCVAAPKSIFKDRNQR